MSLEFVREHLCLGRPSIHTPSHGACLPLDGTEVCHARFLGLRQANTRCSEQLWLSWTAAILSNQKPDALMQDRAFDRTASARDGQKPKIFVHARFFGGHGVSGTGVSGGLPAAQAKRLSTTSWSILLRVAIDAEPRWGNNTTWSIAMSSAGTSGSRAKTSRPADRMIFCCSALISAGSSTTEPRDMLMRMPSGPSDASTSALIRFLVSAPPGVMTMSTSTSRAMSISLG